MLLLEGRWILPAETLEAHSLLVRPVSPGKGVDKLVSIFVLFINFVPAIFVKLLYFSNSCYFFGKRSVYSQQLLVFIGIKVL